MSEANRGKKPLDVMLSREAYQEFYDRLGREYPETQVVHGNNPFNMIFLLNLLRPYAESGIAMLDVGCNDGVYSIPYCRMGGRVHGIDISRALVEKAKANARGLSATFEAADIEEYHTERKFGLVFMSEVIEHVRTPDTAIRNAVNALAPDGHLMLTTPSAYYNLPTLRYLAELMKGKKLLEKEVIDTDSSILGTEWGISGFTYRHDGYYLFALRRWLEGFHLRTIRAFTIRTGGRNTLFRYLMQSLEKRIRIDEIPLINMFGLTCVLIMKHK